jgi:hypothetical protein
MPVTVSGSVGFWIETPVGALVELTPHIPKSQRRAHRDLGRHRYR